MLKASTIALAVLLTCPATFAQKHKKKEKEELGTFREEWFEGSILTSDGKELKGLVWYNDNTGVLSFNDGELKKVFTARSANGFEFFDEGRQKQRIFYTLDYNDPNLPGGGKRPFFFEVLKEFKNFAVLIKADPLQMETKSGGGQYNPGFGYTPGSDYTEISQVETVYFLSSAGAIEPYLKVIKKEFIGRAFVDDREKNKLVDDDLLAKYIGEVAYNKLKEYAKSNDLKFRNKEDFIKIIDYYASTLSK